jgi:RNA polymerase sigma-70 factor (ECF subfamily)
MSAIGRIGMVSAAYRAVFGSVVESERRAVTFDFDALYREHFGFVWRSLRRLGLPQHALDDAAQEVFVVVHRRAHELDLSTSPKACLFAITQRVASDQRRWVRRKGHTLPLTEEPAGTSASPLEQAMQREASDLVLAFLDQLDDARRAVFVLSELEQMTAPEIAQALSANLNTVYYRIASGRRAFVAYLAQHRPELQEERHG